MGIGQPRRDPTGWSLHRDAVVKAARATIAPMSVAPPSRRPRGFIFDLDGTLVANMPLHEEAFRLFTDRHGLPRFTVEMRARLDGKRNRDIFPILFDEALSPEALRDYADEKETLYRELSKGRLVALAGLTRLLDALERRELPAALATSAPLENVAHTLGELGLSRRLTRIVRSDTMARGKPHPDVFLAAAQLIEVRPEDCLAFEDAPAGILAARAAGMTCVAVTTSFPGGTFAAHGAAPDVEVADFDDFLSGPGAWLLDVADDTVARGPRPSG
jgi:beta-phosphoglucomutase